MRIVHVITRLILGGAQENTLLTCLEQARLGHDVTLLAGPPLGPEGSLMELAMSMPFRTVLVPPLRRALRPWSDLEAYVDLGKHFRDLRPDVVHTHSSKAGILGRLAARRAGVPCVVHTIHGLAFDAYKNPVANALYRAVERSAGRRSDRLIAVCRDMADRAAVAGLAPRDRIAVVYSGMDVDRLRAGRERRDEVRRRWQVGPADVVLLKIARLFHMKGHEFVLPAFADVLARCPAAVLVLAGDGFLRPRLEAEVRRLGIQPRVRFLGLVPPDAIPAALWAADVVVHAGLREGLARVLPEAGFCRRPVVAYDVGGAREVVLAGGNGFLLEPPSPGTRGRLAWQPLAEAMAGLACNPDLARRLGEQWPEDILARFDYRTATRQIMDVYEGVLGGS
jgi:glycosyltransferase involved in cell wall biosynthesis